MSVSLAVPAPNGPDQSPESGSEIDLAYDELRRHVARLLGQGFHAKQIAKALVSRLSDTGNEYSAYQKVLKWQRKDPKFRDLIFQEAVVALDLKTPLILGGVANAAMRGKVDAARLALEITGRHTSHEAPVTQVNVVLQNIPRPVRGEVIDGEAVEEQS